MRTFDWALFELYNDGHIAYEEAIRNADSANELRLNIKLRSPRGEPATSSAIRCRCTRSRARESATAGAAEAAGKEAAARTGATAEAAGGAETRAGEEAGAGGPATGDAEAAEAAAAGAGGKVGSIPAALRVSGSRRPRVARYALRALRCAMRAAPSRRSASADRRDAQASALRRARSCPRSPRCESSAYSGMSSMRRPASATRWPMIGPSARANDFSTNHGNVCASSFSVPPSSTSPSSLTNSFHRPGSARNAGTLSGDNDSTRSGVAPASGALSSEPRSPIRKPVVIGPTRTMNARPACAASRSRAQGSSASTRLTRRQRGVEPGHARSGVLLNPGQQPARRAVDRLDEVPHFLERLRVAARRLRASSRGSARWRRIDRLRGPLRRSRRRASRLPSAACVPRAARSRVISSCISGVVTSASSSRSARS